MNHRFVFYCVVLFSFISLISCLNAFDITTVTTITDKSTHQKIRLRIKLDPTEQGIFHDKLRFSVDTPSISLNSWEASIQPTTIHHAAGKYSRMLYTESFFATLAITVEKKALQKMPVPTLCVASFVLMKNGSIKAKTVDTPLAALPAEPLSDTVTTTSCDQTTVATPQNQHTHPSPLPTTKLFSEFSIVDGLAALWYAFIGLCLGFLRWRHLWILYLSLLVLYILFLLKKHTNARSLHYAFPFSPRWDTEVRRTCLWLFVGITSYWISSYFSPATGWFMASALMAAANCYYSAGIYKPRTFLEKLTLLIGFVCGLLVIPLLVKGLLVLHENNIFEIFGK